MESSRQKLAFLYHNDSFLVVGQDTSLAPYLINIRCSDKDSPTSAYTLHLKFGFKTVYLTAKPISPHPNIHQAKVHLLYFHYFLGQKDHAGAGPPYWHPFGMPSRDFSIQTICLHKLTDGSTLPAGNNQSLNFI